MANIGRQQRSETRKPRILLSAAKLFLSNGYSKTTIKDIAKDAEATENSIYFLFGDKESVLAELVNYVLGGQFKRTEKLLENIPHDKIQFYAAETTLQLHISESSEQVREIYAAAYSMPKTTTIIQDTITGKLEDIFKDSLPHLESKDFYEREIASGGIMRGFMTIPCDRYFTMDRKVSAFLESTFKIYDVPMEKIKESIEFVSQFDFAKIAQDTIHSMLSYLEEQT